MFKVNNKDTRTTPLAFRVFGSIRHHSISSAFKNRCFGKGRICCRKKLQKVKQGARVLTELKSDFTQTKFQTKVQCLFFLHTKFSCSDNITARNSKTKCYKELHLSRFSGGLSTGVASIFMRGGRKSDIMDFLYYHEL